MSRSQKNSTISRPADGPIAFVPAAPGWHIIAPIYDGYSCDGVHVLRTDETSDRRLEDRDPHLPRRLDVHLDGPDHAELERDHECLEYAGHYYIVEENDFATEQEVIAYFNKREAKRTQSRGGAGGRGGRCTMKSKIRNLHPHRIVDDDLATRLATGIWEPPPSTSTHAADENDDEAADHSDDQPSDELKIARIVRREPGTAKELAAAFLRFNRESALIWKPYSVLHIASGDVYSIKSFIKPRTRSTCRRLPARSRRAPSLQCGKPGSIAAPTGRSLRTWRAA